MKETNQQRKDTDTLHDVRRTHCNIPKTFLGTLSGRAKLWLQTWQDEFQEAITDKQIFLLMPERETTKPHINRKNKVEESEV